MPSSLPVLVLILSSVLWGLLWLPNKQVHAAGVDGLPMIAIAYTGLSLLLLPWLLRQRALWLPAWPWMLAIVAIGGAASVSFNAALIYGDVIRAMVLFYLLPVWGVFGGRIFLGEKIDLQRMLSVVLALLGAFLLLGASFDLFAQLGTADLIALASGFFYAMNNILFRASASMPILSKIAAMFCGGALLAVLLLVAGVGAWPALTPTAIGMSLGVGFTFLLFASLGTQWAVTKMDAGRSAVIMVLELVTAVVSAALLGASVLGTREMVGVALVLLATLLESWRGGEAAGLSQTQKTTGA